MYTAFTKLREDTRYPNDTFEQRPFFLENENNSEISFTNSEELDNFTSEIFYKTLLNN